MKLLLSMQGNTTPYEKHKAIFTTVSRSKWQYDFTHKCRLKKNKCWKGERGVGIVEGKTHIYKLSSHLEDCILYI